MNSYDSIKGVPVVKTMELPTKVFDKEKGEWITVHMLNINGKIYVSAEVYDALIEDINKKQES